MSKDTRSIHIYHTYAYVWCFVRMKRSRDTMDWNEAHLGQIGVIAYLGVHGHLAGVDPRRRDDERRGQQERQHRSPTIPAGHGHETTEPRTETISLIIHSRRTKRFTELLRMQRSSRIDRRSVDVRIDHTVPTIARCRAPRDRHY